MMEQQNNNKKPQMNMPKFNMNWIYGIVIVLLITVYRRRPAIRTSR